jgi:hypothetical protein
MAGVAAPIPMVLSPALCQAVRRGPTYGRRLFGMYQLRRINFCVDIPLYLFALQRSPISSLTPFISFLR